MQLKYNGCSGQRHALFWLILVYADSRGMNGSGMRGKHGDVLLLVATAAHSKLHSNQRDQMCVCLCDKDVYWVFSNPRTL